MTPKTESVSISATAATALLEHGPALPMPDEFTLLVDGKEVAVATDRVAEVLSSMVPVDEMTMSYSRKLNTEQKARYSTFCSEDFFLSGRLNFRTMWESIPKTWLLEPNAQIWKTAQDVMRRKMGLMARLLYRGVVAQVEMRARQVGIPGHPWIAEELKNFNDAENGFDPFRILPPAPEKK